MTMLQIGQLAKRAGVSGDTLRFYESGTTPTRFAQ